MIFKQIERLFNIKPIIIFIRCCKYFLDYNDCLCVQLNGISFYFQEKLNLLYADKRQI